MAKDRAGNDFVTLVNTPGGFFTPATAPAKTVTETDLDKIVDNLLKVLQLHLPSQPSFSANSRSCGLLRCVAARRRASSTAG